MIGKNNKYLRNTKSGVKVETYSIKKFKVGAASVIIGASIFFGAAGVANAAEVSGDKTENIVIEKVTSSTDEKTDANSTLNNNTDANKQVEKKVLDKKTLQTNIEKVEELLEKINKDKAAASTLETIKIDLENAKEILNSADAELTQAEVDALAKKLSEKIFVLSSMPKANTSEKVVKEGENTIANTGTRDSRNGQSMDEGTQFRADSHNPTGETLTVPYNHNITDDEVKAKVRNFGPGTLKVQSKPSTNTSGNVGNAVVIVTYPDKSTKEVPVSVTVINQNKDDYTPKYDGGSGKPGAKIEISLKEENGKDIPEGTTYTSLTPEEITVDAKGKVTVTVPSDKNPRDKVTGKVFVRYPDKSTEEVPVSVTVINQDKDDYTPQYNDGSGKPGATVDISVTEATGKIIPEGTTYTSLTPEEITVDDQGKITVTIPSDKNPGDKVTGKVFVRYPDKSTEEVPVSVTVLSRDRDDYTPKYDDSNGKSGTSVEIPLTEATGKTIPAGTTYTSLTPDEITVDNKGKVTVVVPSDKNPGDKVTGKVFVRYPDRSTDEVLVNVTVVNRDKDDYTPKYDDGGGKPGTSVEIPVEDEKEKVPEPIPVEVPVEVTVTPKKPDGSTYPPGTKVEIPGKESVEVTVEVPDKDYGLVDNKPIVHVEREKVIYTPYYEEGRGKPGLSVEIPVSEARGRTIPSNTVFKSDQPGITVDSKGKVTVTIPADKNPGDKVTGTITVTYPDGTIDEAPVSVIVVNLDKDYYTLKYPDGKGEPGARVEIPVSEANGKTIPEGTTYTSLTPGEITVDNQGKVTVTIPADKNPGDKVTGKVLVRYPDRSEEEVPVSVTVIILDKNNYTPKYEEGRGKPGATVEIPLSEANGKKIPARTTYKSLTPEGILLYSSGRVIVRIPEEKKPGDEVTGKVLVRYPDGSEEEVPVRVIVISPDKDDYTPKYDEGRGKPGASVEIPVSEVNGKKIPARTTYTSGTPGIITVDKTTGKVTVRIPTEKNPGDIVTGNITVTYPDNSTDNVEVSVTVLNRDRDDYTPQYNGGSGKPGASVEIPVSEANGKTIPANTTYVSDQPGVIKVDAKGKVTVTIPREKNPGDKITGKVTVTYPDGSKEDVPVSVTVLNRDKDDYTPKYEGRGKPRARVEIPVSEENGKIIPAGTTYTSLTPEVVTVDDQGKVTVTIPANKKPGEEITGKVLVRYPDESSEEAPVIVTVVDRDKGDYTPKYDDGTGKPGARVEIPLKEENKKDIPAGTIFTSLTPEEITVDDQGKVTVTIPSDKNTGDKVTGKVFVRYPDNSVEEVPVSVTVLNRDKDIYTPQYNDRSGKPGASVEIPLKEENGKDIPVGTIYTSLTPGEIIVDNQGKLTVAIPSDKNPGDKVTGRIFVRYPDKSAEEVPVSVTVVNRDKDIYTPNYDDGSGKPGTTVDIPVSEANGKIIPAGTTYTSLTPGKITVDDQGKVTVTIPENKNPGDKVTGRIFVRYPDKSAEEVSVTVTVINVAKSGGRPIVEVPVVTTPAKIGTSANGELPNPIDLPKLIITKWVDEEGNELRPKDAKTPSKLGEPNEVYEHGTIPGYEYVRTEINTDGDVVTHIFRKIALGRIDGNDGKQIEDNTKDTTMNKSTKRLANTGESETNTVLAGLGLAMLGNLLAVVKRRREDEK
ncbi:YPDG domain-containing protein [uncultured Gemella sp.]|uniref:YPDG domain-containing protein n=1 Tax=uncultured Gemella sp. TaxID=254352 RepID=UPI0028D8F952|nr:YPDG domain-containing protein [uncultured Gemella sp.]